MSRENAFKFIELVGKDQSLLARVLDGCASAAAWVAEAASTGYQCSVDELRSACEQIVGKPLQASSLVGELRNLFEGSLAEPALATVVGGASGFSSTRLNGLIRATRDPFVLIGPKEDWSNDPKHFDIGGVDIPDFDLGGLGGLGGRGGAGTPVGF